MAPRGRKPKPTALKKLQGNPGKRKLKTKSEPKPPTTKRAAEVVDLSKDNNLAADFIAKYRPTLQALGLLTDVDDPAIEMAARHYNLAIKAYEEVERDGLTVMDDHAQERKHPLLQVFRDNSQTFKGWITEFGMTPSSRARLAIDEADQLSIYERSLEEKLFGDKARVVEVSEQEKYD